MPNENPPVNAFKKGHKKLGGRPPGRRNVLTNDLKEALLEAATRVGFVREVDILDANGKPTGKKKPEWDGDGGLAGYLEWAAVFQPGHFIPQLGKVMPIQINAVSKIETKPVVRPILLRGGKSRPGTNGWLGGRPGLAGHSTLSTSPCSSSSWCRSRRNFMSR